MTIQKTEPNDTRPELVVPRPPAPTDTSRPATPCGTHAKRPVTRSVVAIPALQPSEDLPELVYALIGNHVDVIVVDDGSGPGYDDIFDLCSALGATVHRLEENHGKGYALRQAFLVADNVFPGHGVVTADADGQHRLDDILTIRQNLDTSAVGNPADQQIVLGVREFPKQEVPLRSRFGNMVSAAVFRLVTGVKLGDTQTGLRGIPATHLEWVASLPGDRYELEYTMLVRAAREGVGLRQVPIGTVYEDDNAASHFRPFRDSLRVLGPVAAFGGSSALSFVVDTGLFLGFSALGAAIGPALVGARLISGTMNFAVNRWAVFRGGKQDDLRHAATRYAALALAILAGGVLIVNALVALGASLLLAKITADVILFVLSYVVQRLVVFRSH
jgi:putative flippase GtrA